MSDFVLMALAAGVGTWLLTALGAGAALLLPRSASGSGDHALGFAAGVMIAASFWSLLEPAIALAAQVSRLPEWLPPTLGFPCGALGMYAAHRLCQRFLPEDRTASLVLSITVHNIPEGLAIGVAFGALSADPGGDALIAAVGIALGIGLQNFPEGAAVTLPLLSRGSSPWRSFLLGQASALVEPVAALVGACLVSQVRTVLPYALSFAAGAMVLVALQDLIPGRSEGSWKVSGWAIAGFTVMMLLDVMLG